MTAAELRKRAKAAMGAILVHPGQVYTNEWLLRAADLPPEPVEMTAEGVKAHSFMVLQFREALQDHCLKETGRALEVVHGQGFRLLSADDSVEYISHRFQTRALGNLRKGSRRLRMVDRQQLSPEAVDRQERDGLRLAMLTGGLTETPSVGKRRWRRA